MGFLAGVAPARPQLRAALRPTASGSCLHPMPPRHVPHHPPARLRSQPRPSPQSSATHPPAPAGQRSASGPFFGEFGVFLLALPPGGHGLVQLPVQLPALIAKLPATALNSFSQAPSGIDVVSLSVVRKFQAPSSGNSTAAARLMLPLVPRSLHESRLRSLSLFVLSFAGLPVSLQRLVPSPHHPSVAAALYLGCRRSSRAPWSPLLASLSSFLSSCPPPARHSVRS